MRSKVDNFLDRIWRLVTHRDFWQTSPTISGFFPHSHNPPSETPFLLRLHRFLRLHPFAAPLFLWTYFRRISRGHVSKPLCCRSRHRQLKSLISSCDCVTSDLTSPGVIRVTNHNGVKLELYRMTCHGYGQRQPRYSSSAPRPQCHPGVLDVSKSIVKFYRISQNLALKIKVHILFFCHNEPSYIRSSCCCHLLVCYLVLARKRTNKILISPHLLTVSRGWQINIVSDDYHC